MLKKPKPEGNSVASTKHNAPRPRTAADRRSKGILFRGPGASPSESGLLADDDIRTAKRRIVRTPDTAATGIATSSSEYTR